MYVILVYDIGQKRVGKMLKLCRQYLNWIQNSVFEGEITEVKLKMLLADAKLVMDEENDSVIIFKSRNEKWLEKQVVGKDLQWPVNSRFFHNLNELIDFIDKLNRRLMGLFRQ